MWAHFAGYGYMVPTYTSLLRRGISGALFGPQTPAASLALEAPQPSPCTTLVGSTQSNDPWITKNALPTAQSHVQNRTKIILMAISF